MNTHTPTHSPMHSHFLATAHILYGMQLVVLGVLSYAIIPAWWNGMKFVAFQEEPLSEWVSGGPLPAFYRAMSIGVEAEIGS